MRKGIKIVIIYIIIGLLILIPLSTNGYIFAIDKIPGRNDYRLNLFYGKVIPNYGGSLLFDILSTLISVDIFHKIILFLALFLSGYLMHNLIIKMNISNIAALYAGFLYMINPFTYTRILAGHWYISYAIIPLLLIFFIDLLKKRQNKDMIKFVFVLSIVAFNIHMLIISLIIVAITFLFWSNKYKDIRITKLLAISGILFIFLNSYWIVPLLTAKNMKVDNIGERDHEVFSPTGSSFEIATMHGFWKERYIYAKDFIPGWQILYLIISILAIIGIISYYKDEKIGIYIKSFIVIWIIGLILASGVNGLFGDIVRWLFENTIMKGFRDGYKFVIMLVLSYAILGGMGLNKIKDVYDKNIIGKPYL